MSKERMSRLIGIYVTHEQYAQWKQASMEAGLGKRGQPKYIRRAVEAYQKKEVEDASTHER